MSLIISVINILIYTKFVRLNKNTTQLYVYKKHTWNIRKTQQSFEEKGLKKIDLANNKKKNCIALLVLNILCFRIKSLIV